MTALLLVLFSGFPTVDELRKLAGVAEVTINAVESPTHRIVHILNWHWISADRFHLDNPDGDYSRFLDEVDAIQMEQMALIRAMKIRTVRYEGLTVENQAAYLKKVETLRKLKRPDGDSPTDELLRQFIREDLLQLGAPGRLLLTGELEAVLPADGAKHLDAADPVKGDKIEFNPEAVQARERATVELLLKQPESVLICGGVHDFGPLLTDSEYVRVTTKGYRSAVK